METILSPHPFAAMLCSLLAVPLIVWSGSRPNLREAWTLLAAFAQCFLVMGMLPTILDGKTLSWELAPLLPGAPLALRVDALGLLFALIASTLWIVTSFYAIGYMRGHHETKQTRFFASFALSLFATLGVAFSANLATFILFYELLTLATYPLVIHKESAEAIRSGRQYLAYSLTAGLFLVVGAAWVYQTAGTLDFKAGGVVRAGMTGAAEYRWGFLLFVAGVGVKAGLMPFHSWLPNAMVAPTPVSALLHAVAVVKSGAFGMIRMAGFVLGPATLREYDLHLILACMAGFTVIVSSLIALRQDSLKRRLAYSTVGHLSYIVLGVSLLTPTGFLGAIYHMSTHAFMKITLFFCAGAIYVHAGRQKVSELDGLGRSMPWTFGAFAIGALGLVGIPPINGFFSKWFLCIGAVEAGWGAAVAVFLVSGLLNASYLLPIVHRAFLKPPTGTAVKGDASPWMLVPIIITASLALGLGLLPDLGTHFFSLARLAAQGLTGIDPVGMAPIP